MEIALSSLGFAFEAVKENNGCAGVDRMTLRAFERNLLMNLQILQDRVARKVYKPLPLMKILIPKKKEGDPRKLCIPAVRDRVLQKAVLNLIEPVLDKEFEDSSFAYRKGYSVKRAALQINTYYRQGYRWIVDADIDDFFDNVDHDLLLEKFREVINNKDIAHLLNLWLKTETWGVDGLSVSEKGIPQGSPISPVLANLFLDEIDEKLDEKGYKYIRYADNYLLLGKNEKEAERAFDLSTRLLDEIDLDLEVENVTSFDKGFKYLGVFFLNDLVMKPIECDIKKTSEPVFPGPFDMAEWLNRYREY